MKLKPKKIDSIESIDAWLKESPENSLYCYVPCPECNLETDISAIGTITAGNNNISVKSLSEQPQIKIQQELSESVDGENIWIVDDFEFMEGACGTSKIIYKGDSLYMNVCESDGKAKVSLILEIDEKIKHVQFTLKKSCNMSDAHDMILSI